MERNIYICRNLKPRNNLSFKLKLKPNFFSCAIYIHHLCRAYPNQIIFVAIDADGPVGETAPEEPV